MGEKMKRRTAVAMTIIVVAFGLTTVSTVQAASGELTPPPGCVEESPAEGGILFRCTNDEGLLRLHLGTSDYFRFEPVDGSSVTQAINTSGCRATLGPPELVTLLPGPTGATLGQKDDSLGVRFNEGGGQPCAQVNNTGPTGQSLVLSLGSVTSADGALVDWAEVDIERKFNAVVRLEFFAGGTGGTSTGVLVLGCSASLSDCGPDSGDGDNFRLDTNSPPDGQASPGPFDTIVMSLDSSGPSNGAFSLEGGADGTAPGPVGATLGVDVNDSIFHLITTDLITYDGTLDCNDSDSVVVPSEPGATPTSSTIARLQNKEGACELVPYTLTASYVEATGEQQVEFNVGLTGQETAEFEWVLEWDSEPATYPVVKTTSIDFGDGVFTPLQWCGGTYDPAGATPDLRMADVESIPGVGGCLAYQTSTLTGGEVQVTEVLKLSNDPLARR